MRDSRRLNGPPGIPHTCLRDPESRPRDPRSAQETPRAATSAYCLQCKAIRCNFGYNLSSLRGLAGGGTTWRASRVRATSRRTRSDAARENTGCSKLLGRDVCPASDISLRTSASTRMIYRIIMSSPPWIGLCTVRSKGKPGQTRSSRTCSARGQICLEKIFKHKPGGRT